MPLIVHKGNPGLGISSILFRTGWGRLRAIPAWVLVFCSSGFAQAPNPTFHVDDDITLIDVQVVDTATGQAIRDLRQSDFVVLAENWLPRDIAVFEAENTPLDLAVVLDLSGIPHSPSGSAGRSSAVPTQLRSA